MSENEKLSNEENVSKVAKSKWSKVFNVPTLGVGGFLLGSVSYYYYIYCQSYRLTFDFSDRAFLGSFAIATFWIVIYCGIMIFKNHALLKTVYGVVQNNTALTEKSIILTEKNIVLTEENTELIRQMEKQLVDLEEQVDDNHFEVMSQNEDNFSSTIQSIQHNREVLFDVKASKSKGA